MRRQRSTSPAQAAAWASRAVPLPEVVVPDRLVAAPMATRVAHIPFSFSYLLVGSQGELHLIDPGMDLPENLMHLSSAASLVGADIDDIASVLVSHLHVDHMGLSNTVRDRVGAQVRIHEREYKGLLAPNPVARGSHDAWGVPERDRARLHAGVVSREPIVADAFVQHDEVVDLGGTQVRALLTPGHTYGHLCFDVAELGVFLTGDHVLPTMNPGLGLGHDSETNPVEDYLSSLATTARYDDRESLPGHGYRFVGLAHRCEQITSHVTRRLEEVAALLATTPAATVWELASRVRWGAGWENLDGFYMQSALHQVSLYSDLVHRRIEESHAR